MLYPSNLLGLWAHSRQLEVALIILYKMENCGTIEKMELFCRRSVLIWVIVKSYVQIPFISALSDGSIF